MKGFIFKFILGTGLCLGIANYGIYLATGHNPLAKLLARANPKTLSLPTIAKPDLHLPKLPSIPHLPDNPDITRDNTEETSAYKWVDRQGVVHYSDAAPQRGETVKLIKVNPNTNLIQGAPPYSPTPVSSNRPDTTYSDHRYSNDKYLPPAHDESPLERAENVNKLINDRQNNNDETLENDY